MYLSAAFTNIVIDKITTAVAVEDNNDAIPKSDQSFAAALTIPLYNLINAAK